MINLRRAKYQDKERLKQLGARWNPNDRVWYVPNGKDLADFREFMDDETRFVYDDIVGHLESVSVYADVAEHMRAVYRQDQLHLMAEKHPGRFVDPNGNRSDGIGSPGGDFQFMSSRSMNNNEKDKREDVLKEQVRRDNLVRRNNSLSEEFDLRNNFDIETEDEKSKKKDAFKKRSTYEHPSFFMRTSFKKLGLPDDFVVIDTETTGVSRNDEVIELSVLDSNANELYHSFFKPSCPVNGKASAVSGIHTEDLSNEPRFCDEWPKILDIIDNRCIAGHNISFDQRLIQQTLEKQTQTDHAFECDLVFSGSIDSLAIAKQYDMGVKSYSLSNLCDAIGVEKPPNHRTSYDCLGVLYVLQDLEKSNYPKKSNRRLPSFVGDSERDSSDFEFGI